MRKRVLFLEALSGVRGGQQTLLDLLSWNNAHAGQAQFEPLAVLPDAGELSDKLLAIGVRPFFLPMCSYSLIKKGPKDLLAFPLEQIRLGYLAARIARREKADLLYANSSRTFIWGTLAALLCGKRIIWHLHNDIEDRKTRWLLNRFSFLSPVARILAATPGTIENYACNFRKKAEVIPYGVDPARFAFSQENRDRIRREFGIPDEAKVVGLVGDFIPGRKNQHILVEAVKKLPLHIHTLIVGDARPADAESKAYRESVKEGADNRVHFAGARNDLACMFSAMDLLTVLSSYETGPLSLLQALSCPLPALCTKVGMAPAVLPGEWLLDESSPETVAGRILEFFSDAEELGRRRERALQIARELFSLERYCNSIHAAINTAIEQANNKAG